MTAEELREIFNKAEIVTFGHGTPPMYQFYTFTSNNRGASVVGVSGIEELVETLTGFRFVEYAPVGIPVFSNVPIEGTVATPSLENN